MGKARDILMDLIDRSMETAGGIIAEARFELIDRGWFGRYPHGTAPGHHHDQQSMAEKLGWSQEPATDQKAQAWDTLCSQIVQEINREPAHEPEPGRDMDL